jgi:ribosome biogenesis ATPase
LLFHAPFPSVGVIVIAAPRKILRCLTVGVKMREEGEGGGGLDFKELARLTPGYVGADLGALVKEAGMVAIDRLIKKSSPSPPPPPSSSSPPKPPPSSSGSIGLATTTDSGRGAHSGWAVHMKPASEAELAEYFVEMDDFRAVSE